MPSHHTTRALSVTTHTYTHTHPLPPPAMQVATTSIKCLGLLAQGLRERMSPYGSLGFSTCLNRSKVGAGAALVYTQGRLPCCHRRHAYWSW
jgi:hypothetical protein